MTVLVCKEMDLDTIYKDIGQSGKYQLFTMFLLALPAIFSVFPTYEYIFTARDIAYRCHIPECESNATLASYHAEWLELAIPSGQKCARFAPSSAGDSSCSVGSFDRNKTIPCQDYVYGETNSMIREFNMPCEEWKSSLIGTVSNLAYFLILPVTGILSDRFGRKIVLVINAVNTAFMLIVRAYSVSYEMYIAVTFLGGVIGAGAFTTCYLMACELFSKEYRAYGGVSITTAFALGHCVIGLVAWVIPEWRTIEKVLAFPQIITLLYFFLLPESIRWLLIRRKFEEAKKSLKVAATANGREGSHLLIETFINSLNTASNTDVKSTTKHEKSLFKRIKSSKAMVKRILITPLWWFGVIFVYYGSTINSVRLAGNIYMNFMLVTLIEIPGYILGLYGMNKYGRKTSLWVGLAISSAMNYVWPFVPLEYQWVHLVMTLLGKMFISLAAATLYAYTVELYPTEMRHSAMALSSMVARIGAICAPQTPLLATIWSPIPNLVFGVTSTLACLSVFLLPETLNTDLPDTIEDIENTTSI